MGLNITHAASVRQNGESMKKDIIKIAIDGPSGAGKSTIARYAATKYGFIYIDTGAMYRTVGLAAYRSGVNSKDREGVIALLPDIHINLVYGDDGLQHMLLNGEDVSDSIRTPVISIYASDVSAMPEVRAFLLQMQRDLAAQNNSIMDGRDIGTVVLPDAGLKIFLTATVEDRAMRRYLELQAKEDPSTYEQVLTDMQYRDANDSSRAAAPLRAADDAILVDTTGNTLEQSQNIICGIIEERFGL